MNKKVTFKSMLKNKHFVKLFLAGVISRFGDSVDMIAYGFMVYKMTGSAVLMATLYAVNGIPSLLFSMVAGVVVTRWPKKKVIWICDFMRGLFVLITGILFVIGHLAVWHLYLFTILNSTFEAFRSPSASALIVQLIPEEEIAHATSLNTSASTFSELIGYAVAALIIGVIGVGGAIILDGVTFLISGTIIASIAAEKEVLVKTKLTIKNYFEELKEGMVYVIKSPLMLTLSIFIGSLMLMLAPFNALQMPYILETLNLGTNGISVLSICFMLAMVVSSLIVPGITEKIGGRTTFIAGGVFMGLGYLLMGYLHVLEFEMAKFIGLGFVAALMGFNLMFIQVPMTITLMKKVDRALMTRVFSLISVLGLSAVPIGGGLVGAIVNYVSISTFFAYAGIGVILIFITQLFNKSLKEMDGKQSEEVTELEASSVPS